MRGEAKKTSNEADRKVVAARLLHYFTTVLSEKGGKRAHFGRQALEDKRGLKKKVAAGRQGGHHSDGKISLGPVAEQAPLEGEVKLVRKKSEKRSRSFRSRTGEKRSNPNF